MVKYSFIITLFLFLQSVAIGENDQDFGTVPLVADDREVDDVFGESVSIDGDIAAVGSPGNGEFGAVYIYELSEGNWIQSQKLTVNNEVELDGFGTTLAMSSGRLIVGAHKSDAQKGFVFVFEQSDEGWLQTAKLTADDAQALDQFGRSIALSGDRIIVGAPWTDDLASRSGSVYVFDLVNGEWSQTIKVQASDGSEDDFFGIDVSIDNDRFVVGAAESDDRTGSAYVFELDQGAWIEQQKLTLNNGENFDAFGLSVSISGDKILVGVPGRDLEFNNAGAAYIYTLNDSTWVQGQEFFDVNGQVGEAFGADVSVNADRLLIGSRGSEVLDVSNQLSWVYELKSDLWVKIAGFTVDDDDNGIEDKFYGTQIDMSADRIIVGSIGFDDFIGGAFIYHVDNIFKSGF